MTASADARCMALALGMARRGLGQTAPNPCVGAVIVNDDTVLAVARTNAGGRPHAETEALGRAGEAARGATLYVTLEPCAHHGRTPPCAEAIIAAGIARVVAGITDPDARVAGQGLARLRAAGVRVDVGQSAAACLGQLAGHVLRVTAGRPLVTLKVAVDADGRVAAGTGAPVWVTGETARAHGQLLRARSEAIVVGRGTIEADDPALNCRLPGMAARSPLRVVLDRRLSISPAARVVGTARLAPTLVAGAPDTDAARIAVLIAAGAEVSTTGTDPAAVLGLLAARGVTRVLVEGGPRVARSFLEGGVVDEVVVYRGARRVDGASLPPFVDAGLALIDNGFIVVDERRLGADRMTRYRCASGPLADAIAALPGKSRE